MAKRKRTGASPFQPASITLRRKPVAKRATFKGGVVNKPPVLSTAVRKLKPTVIPSGPAYTDQKGRQVRVVNLWERGD